MANELIAQDTEPADYGTPPPPYTDVYDDLPPEYSALPALAEAKLVAKKSAPPLNNFSRSRTPKSKPVSSINFESTHGFRQHGKKQKAKMAAKKAVGGSSGGDGGDSGKKTDETIDPPGGSGLGGSAGGDDGGDGGDLSWADDLDNNNNNNNNDDSWAGFTSVGKKDSKKKNSVS